MRDLLAMVIRQGIMKKASSKPSGSLLVGLSGLVCLGLAGCAASEDRYPSLAPRAIETARAPVQAPPDPIPLSTTALAQVADLTARARASHQRFQAAQPGALQLASTAANAGRESDVRARALVAAARLSALRGETSVALGGLDDLEAEAAANFAETGEIRAAQQQMTQWIASQSEAIAIVERRLGL